MQKRPQSQVRIIGGQWKRSKLPFVAHPALRPTPDRIKETLFNWLSEHLLQARCLDLFAGSGALGFEALSRGAAQVTFVDTEKNNIQQIQSCMDKFKVSGERYALHVQDGLQYLRAAQNKYDIVFLDPPYGGDLLTAALIDLAVQPLLSAKALIYAEHARGAACTEIAGDWTVLQHETAGQVEFYLLTRT